MFSIKKHQCVLIFFENEWVWGEKVEETWTRREISQVPETIKPQVQQNQELLDSKRTSFLSAQKKTITLWNELEKVAMNKVQAALETRLFDDIKDPKEREDQIKMLVNEFMTKYKSEYDSLKKNLEWMNPPLPEEEIQIQLQEQESFAFEQFINAKIKEQNIEKRKELRKQRYLKALISTGDGEKDKKNQDLVSKFEVDYSAIKSKILEEKPELRDDKIKQRIEIQRAIDEQFIKYCEENGIEIDWILLLQDDGGWAVPSEAQVSEEFVRIDTKWSILHAQNQYLEAASELSTTAQIYQQESARHEKIEQSDDWDQIVYDLPRKIVDLPPWETASFTGSSWSSEVVYEAYREADGEYTLKFNGHTIKDLPKKEMEVVVDLNAIPVVNTIFTASSELYRTLLREYTSVCREEGIDPLQNPPLWFINFLFARLNDAYIATNPDNGDSSLLGLNISDMPTQERGKYIRNLLTMDIWMRDEVIRKLVNQKILVNGKINLSRYPR